MELFTSFCIIDAEPVPFVHGFVIIHQFSRSIISYEPNDIIFAISLFRKTFMSFKVRVNPVHSDEGLTLETSVFESFTVASLPYRPCG